MTNAEREAKRKRANEAKIVSECATAGPWKRLDRQVRVKVAGRRQRGEGVFPDKNCQWSAYQHDVDFVVHARTVMPQLAADWLELAKENQEMEERLKGAHWWCDRCCDYHAEKTCPNEE